MKVKHIKLSLFHEKVHTRKFAGHVSAVVPTGTMHVWFIGRFSWVYLVKRGS